MIRNSLQQVTLTSLTLTSFTIGALLCSSCAQSPTPTHTANEPASLGLPPFLRIVPGGIVEIGMTAGELVATTSQAVSPIKPANAVKAPEKLSKAMRHTASILGVRKVPVETFLLSEWNVKNSEYKAYVDHRRAAKARVRPPFSWWRYGAVKDYEAKLQDIARLFPGDSEGPVRFWERHGHEFPYDTLDAAGKSTADQPVSFVTYAEANEFAGWLGMRLPTEAEWTRAARGDGTHLWPWGKSMPDDFSEARLSFLGLDRSSSQQPVATGTIENAVGPFGHKDMFGRIWQLVSGLGYGPINGPEPFVDEWKALQKDKVGSLLTAVPPWKDDRVLAKGGSYLSWQEPVQLLIDARAPMQSSDVLEGAGFRLAKSLKPGFDLLFSLVRGQYNRAAFGQDQRLDQKGQIGAERYEVGANGFPSAYHAVSFMPVDWLTKDRGGELSKLLDKTHETPLLLGTIAVTEAIKNPDAPAGLYTLVYRKEGMPKDLAEAIKTGHKEVLAAQKQKAKAGDTKPEEAKPDEGKDDKAKKGGWRELCARHGITEADIVDAAHGLKFVRIDGVVVPTGDDCFLLLDALGSKVVAVLGTSNHKPASSSAFDNAVTLEKAEKGGAIAKFHIGVPIKAGEPKRVAEFRLHVTLDTPPPDGTIVWRLPATSATPAPAQPAAPSSPVAPAAAQSAK